MSRFIPANDSVIAELRDNMGANNSADFQPVFSGMSADEYLDSLARTMYDDDDTDAMRVAIAAWDGTMDESL
jgi:hypothetical protein